MVRRFKKGAQKILTQIVYYDMMSPLTGNKAGGAGQGQLDILGAKMNGVIIVRIGFDFGPEVSKIDLTDQGRVFVKHLPEVPIQKGEFSIVRSGDTDFEIAVTPSAPMRANYRKVDSPESLAKLAVEAGFAKTFVPRGFHAVVQSALSDPLTSLIASGYGGNQTLKDERTVLVVSEVPIVAGTLVEAVEAHSNVLMVRPASFEVADPFVHESWAEFVEALLVEEKHRYRGKLVPRSAPKKIHGIWVGSPLDFLNSRGQASTRVLVDGREEGSVADLYFTRMGDPVHEPINPGAKVSIWHTGGANVAVVPYDGDVDRIIDPEVVAQELGIKIKGRSLETSGQIRVTRR